jgi:hypothetical protein
MLVGFLLLSLVVGGLNSSTCEAKDFRLEAACQIVRQYGSKIGGLETIGSLVELNMRDWKPQSVFGIEIYGWKAVADGQSSYRVSFSYRELGRPPVILAWRLDVRTAEINALNPLSDRILKMARVL